MDRLRRRNATLERAIAEKENEEDAWLLTQYSVDYAGDMILWIGPDARFEYANETACRALGYSQDELFRLKLFDVDPDVTSENWPRAWKRVTTRGNYTFETTFVTCDGAVRPIEVSNHFLQYKNRKICCCFCRDITDRRIAEEALREALDEADRANRAKSRFLAAASHDLRQPLQALSLLHHALTVCDVDGQAAEIVSDLGYSVAVMGNMLNRLLDISKLDAGAIIPTIEDIPVDQLLEHIQRLFDVHAAQNDIQLRVVPTGAFVRTDAYLLGQMLENVVANAIHHSKGSKILVGCRRRGGMARLQVWDDGVGIPADQLDAIFEEYFQLENPARDRNFGLGLGLSIVRRVGLLLGHPVDVASQVGRFTRFTVELPLVDPLDDRGTTDPGAGDAVGNFASHIAVLIEDDEVVLKASRGLLEKWGFSVVAGTDAGSMDRELPALTAAPSIIIADYRLAAGRTGTDEVKYIRNMIGQDIPAIIITGDTSTYIRRILATSQIPVLSKPVDPNQLKRLLQQLIFPTAS